MLARMSASKNTTSGRRLSFQGKQQVQIEPFELPPLQEGEVLIKTAFALMSTGTENIVFNRLFEPGTHWDNWVKYPFFPGYCAVGTVLESRCGDLKPGDRVTARSSHQSHWVCPAVGCSKIPDSVPFENAHWFALAKIAFHGALAAGYQLGDSVLVIGAGPIGQMSIRWANAAGATSIIAVDSAAERLSMAAAGGATATISAPIAEAKEAILAANKGKLPRLVIDSTGNEKVFAAALGLADKFGKVVLLGDTGTPSKQQLTSDVIMRGITIVGTHDSHETEEWTTATITELFLTLAASGRFSLEGLNTHFFKPADCVQAYETVNRERARTMGVVFDWREEA